MFTDPLHDEFSTWILGFAPYGGGDVGEVEQLATLVKDGDDDSFFTEFAAWARRLIEEGDAAEAAGHSNTARDCYLRAAEMTASLPEQRYLTLRAAALATRTSSEH